MNNTELKACPFCEGPAKQWQPYAVKSVWKIGCIALGCRVNPEVSGEYDKAVRDWNDRAGGREPAMSKTGGTKGVGMSDLLAAAERDAAFYRKTLEQICDDERKTRGRRIAETALMFWDRIKKEAAERKKTKAANVGDEPRRAEKGKP
jgi:hypothetical protein